MTCLDRFQQQGKLSRLPFVGDLTPNEEITGAWRSEGQQDGWESRPVNGPVRRIPSCRFITDGPFQLASRARRPHPPNQESSKGAAQ